MYNIPKTKDFKQNYIFKTLIYYGKLWYFGKNYGTMVQNCGTIPKSMKL